jgi:pimeloyl-ACP methyl ester carboxylesterase
VSARHSAHFAQPHATYFDRYDLPSSDRPTVVMIHGGGHTGACWLSTPDARPGWASRFLARGYCVIVPDWPGHGRSGALDPDSITGELVTDGLASVLDALTTPVVLVTHSMGGALGWRVAEKRADRIAAVVGLAPGPPGNIQREGKILRETANEIFVDDGLRTSPVQRSGFALPQTDVIIAKLVGNSRRFPRDHLDGYIRTLAHFSARLHYERLNTAGSQVRISDPSQLAGKPILVLTGSEDLDHPRHIDEGIVRWLRQEAEAEADHIWLADRGISGNSHMLMLEENSDEIADLVLDWLEERV